ncbi:hypothetical protein F2Q68_00014218 [Brassica cretica]|uniref:Uncharacterized protein n=1 Tax=Brassica cretica TaxID=69181 RepID=A0A8S9HIY0_BRACR|nr:hypothetical protein F2Q68_00014218 [Brassica cretica]
MPSFDIEFVPSIDVEVVLSVDNEVVLSVDNEVLPSVDVEVLSSVDVQVLPSVDIEVEYSVPTSSTLLNSPTHVVIPFCHNVVEQLDRIGEDLAEHVDLGEEDPGRGLDLPNHTTLGSVVKEEKLQEGDFKVESLMSFGGSHWCRSTPDFEHRSTPASPNRSTGSPEHRPMTPTKSTSSCNAVRNLTHEEFAAKHPHPPNPDNVRIVRRADTSIDRHGESNIDRQRDVSIDGQPSAPIDQRAPITYRVQMPKIDVAHLNAL